METDFSVQVISAVISNCGAVSNNTDVINTMIATSCMAVNQTVASKVVYAHE